MGLLLRTGRLQNTVAEVELLEVVHRQVEVHYIAVQVVVLEAL